MCLLTGAGGRLGAAFCTAYAERYDIVAVCRHRTPAVPSQYETYVDPLDPDACLEDNAHPVHVVYADLEQPGQPQRVIDIALARFGRVDLLINNAAYVRLHPSGLLDASGTMTDFERHFAVNVGLPTVLASQLANASWVHHSEANRSANRNVVNVSSMSATRVYSGGQAVYAASKAALNQMTRHLAAEFETFGVRVNALAPNNFPGVVDTAAVAKAIVRLDGETVTGRVLAVDA